jgi:hypothetical protein
MRQKNNPGELDRFSDGLRTRRLGRDSRQEQDIILWSTVSKSAMGYTQPPIQWVPGVKRPGHEDDHSPPFAAEVKNGGAIYPLPHTSSRRGALII